MRRFVAEHAADAAAAAAGGGSTRCSIFTLCLIADLGVDYINLIPHACALPLRRREGDRLMAGEGVVLILAGGVLFFFSFRAITCGFAPLVPCREVRVGRREEGGRGRRGFYRETELSVVVEEGGEIPRTVFKNNDGWWAPSRAIVNPRVGGGCVSVRRERISTRRLIGNRSTFALYLGISIILF